MFFWKRHIAPRKKAPTSPVPAGFTTEGVTWGKTILDSQVVLSEAKKMADKYTILLNEAISKFDTRCCHFTITYAVSRAGIMYIHNCDGGSIDVAYKDYGISAIESDYKKIGMAWALQESILPILLERFPMITAYTVSANGTNINCTYGWVLVTLSFSITINTLHEL